MSGSDDHSAGLLSPPSCSSKWTAGDALKYLSVRYASAPYGLGMMGQSVHDAYLNLLHANRQPSPMPGPRPSLSRSGSGVGAATGGTSVVSLLTTADTVVPVSRSSIEPRPKPSSSTSSSSTVAATTSGISATTSSTGSPSRLSPATRRHQIQQNMLRHNAGIPIPFSYCNASANEVEEFIELFQVMRELDEQWLKQRGSGNMLQHGSSTWKEFIRRNQSSIQDSDDDEVEEEDIPPKLQPICDVVRVMKCCFQQLERERENLRGKVEREIVTVKHYTERVTRLDRLMKFMNGIGKLIRRSSGLAFCKIDEGIYTDLFRDFAWIFGIEFSSVTTSKPLIVRGQAVSCIPDLLYDKYTEWTMRLPENILIITVVEVKSKASVKTIANHDHQLRKRKHSDSEINPINEQEDDEDSTYLPDSLRGQHACQLVRALTHTYMPNKNCMLGFIVQATKVRLTCLNMEREHCESIKRPDFNPADHDATIYFTRSYDMLDAFDRGHLIHIMVKLATFGGDLE